jgi:uncharacterized protein (TIGR03086 family)
MDEVTLLDGVLTKTGDLVAGVREDQWSLPTPCPEYDVRTLINHLVGWIQVFGASAQGRTFEGDPTSQQVTADPAAEFRTAASDAVAGWREHGFGRTVRMMGGEQPAEMVFNMTLMEYLTHGWDLAIATGQEVPYSENEASETLARAERTLPPQYRGEGMPFGEIVDVPADAPAVDRAVAFLGRRP